MIKIALAIVLATIALLSMNAVAHAGSIANGGFESDSAWTIGGVNLDGKYSAYYSTDWASEGIGNFTFRRGTGSVTAGNYIQISQAGIDLTGATKLIFDCRDTGIDVVPLQFIIDDTNLVGEWQNNGWPGGLGSGWGNTATTLGIEIPLRSDFAGLHQLTIRMWNPVSHFPADPKVYRIDNLRTDVVPEPSSLLALTMGLPALFLRRRRA